MQLNSTDSKRAEQQRKPPRFRTDQDGVCSFMRDNVLTVQETYRCCKQNRSEPRRLIETPSEAAARDAIRGNAKRPTRDDFHAARSVSCSTSTWCVHRVRCSMQSAVNSSPIFPRRRMRRIPPAQSLRARPSYVGPEKRSRQNPGPTHRGILPFVTGTPGRARQRRRFTNKRVSGQYRLGFYFRRIGH